MYKKAPAWEKFPTRALLYAGSNQWMMVPMRSPQATRRMLFSALRPKTRIGMRLSMHRVSAELSITDRPRSMTST